MGKAIDGTGRVDRAATASWSFDCAKIALTVVNVAM